MSDIKYLKILIDESLSGKTVKEIVKSELKVSTNRLVGLKKIDDGLMLDGVRVPVGKVVCKGQELSVRLTDIESNLKSFIPTGMELNILYEDDYILVLDKSAGMQCHPAKGHLDDTVANGIRAYYDGKCEDSSIHFVGRLDMDTSGVLLVAKNGYVAERLVYEKEYRAFAFGTFQDTEGTIDMPIGEERRESDGKLVAKVCQAGKEAITHYRVIEQCDTYALISVRIDTGRMHQIRCHMAYIGHPLLGDSLYGNSDELYKRAMLHAYAVTFTHPISGKVIRVTAKFDELN